MDAGLQWSGDSGDLELRLESAGDPARLDGTGKPAPVWACARLGEERRVLRHECERCPHWIHAYEDALDGVLHPTTQDVIERQCAHVRQSHNRVHALLAV